MDAGIYAQRVRNMDQSILASVYVPSPDVFCHRSLQARRRPVPVHQPSTLQVQSESTSPVRVFSVLRYEIHQKNGY